MICSQCCILSHLLTELVLVIERNSPITRPAEHLENINRKISTFSPSTSWRWLTPYQQPSREMECRQFESSLYSNPVSNLTTIKCSPVPKIMYLLYSSQQTRKPPQLQEKDHSVHRSLGSPGRKQSPWRVTSSHASNKDGVCAPQMVADVQTSGRTLLAPLKSESGT